VTVHIRKQYNYIAYVACGEKFSFMFSPFRRQTDGWKLNNVIDSCRACPP